MKGNVPGDGGPDPDGPIDPGRELVVESRATPIRDVDVLFVIDDSGTMADKQATIGDNFPAFVNALATIPGGLPNLHLGVISTDMGTKGSGSAVGGPDVGAPGNGGCSMSGGKNGTLQLGTAMGVTGTFVSDIKLTDGSRQKNYSDPDLATVFGDMANLGISGCGFEQPLHAMRAALSPGANPGFLRPDALLAVVFLTDEDDCSLRDPALLGPSSPTLGALQSFRCTRFGVTCGVGGQTPAEMNQVGTKDQCTASDDTTFLDDVGTFHDFLVGLKADPGQVVVGGIIGTPTPVAVELVTPPAGGTPLPTLSHSCQNQVGAAVQFGDPAVRMQSFFDLFPNRNATTTICQNDFTEAIEGTANLIAQSAGTPCIGKPLLDTDTSAPGIQADCIVEDSLGTNLTIIQPCDSSNTPTCWRLVGDLVTCPLFDNLRLEVVRDGSIPSDTVTRARCIVK